MSPLQQKTTGRRKHSPTWTLLDLVSLSFSPLVCDVRLKVEQPKDVVTGNPTVIKMLVNFYRHARGHNALRESLGPALQDVLLDRTLSIRTDPVDVYKTWINQTETQTGHKRSKKNQTLIHSPEYLSISLVRLTFPSYLQLSAL